MISLPTALARAAGQLTDPAILRVLVKSVGVTLLVFLVAGVLLYAGLEALASQMGLFAGFEWTFLLSILIAIAAFWLLFRIVAIAVIQFFADEIVMAVEQRHYPGAHAVARDLTFQESLQESLKGLRRAVGYNLLALPVGLVLLFTGIGTVALFWAVNAWLLGRELQDIAWLRHRTRPDEAPPLSKITRFLLGGAIAGLFAIPILNLLAPIIGAAAATHLVHSRKDVFSNA